MAASLKLPPQNLEAEMAVLGSLMLDKDAILKVADLLKSADFYKPSHAVIYEGILALYEKHQPVDILSVTARLTEAGTLTEAGGSSYLTDLVSSVPTAFHVNHYATIVKEKKIL